MVNWADPTLSSLYTQVLTDLDNKDIDAATMFIGSASTNIPTNAIRLASAALGTLERWSGAAWVAQPLRLESSVTLRLPLDPRIQFYDESELLDEKRWDVIVQSSSFFIRAYNDAASVAVNPVSITRTGTVIDAINLAATTVAVTGNITVTGTVDGVDVAAHAGDVSIHTEDNLLAHLAGIETFTGAKIIATGGTTVDSLAITEALMTTGVLLDINSSNNGKLGTPVVRMVQQGVTSTANTVEITNSGSTGIALKVTTSAGTGIDSLASGTDMRSALFHSANANRTVPVVDIVNDAATGTGVALRIQQDQGGAAIDVIGNIAVTGTVDGVDVAAHAGDVSIHTEDNLLAHLAGTETFSGQKTFGTIKSTIGATGTVATHYWMSVGTDNVIRQKTLAQVKTEIVTAAQVNAGATTASTASTAVKRDASGDINARLFRSEYDTTNGTINYIMTQIDTVTNNYMRPSTPAQFRSAVTDGNYAANAHSHGQSELNANSVGQSEIKTATQTNSIVTGGGNLDSVASGGRYHLGNDQKVNTASNNGSGSVKLGSLVQRSDLTAVSYVGVSGSRDTSVVTATGRHEYISSSPPYDLGDGDIPLFVYLLMDASGNIVGTSISPDPPWANNGPTSIVATDKRNGKSYRRYKDYSEVPAGLSGLELSQARAAAPVVEQEITMAIKNADMNLFPYCIVNINPSLTEILLDPVSAMVRDLSTFHEAGEHAELANILNNYVDIGNTALVRVGPAGLLIPSVAWKLT